jgi:protein-S-isoprenylcysteine O-methyltransferase Ste14
MEAVMKVWHALGSALFFLLAPGTVAGLIPYAITGWELKPAFFGYELVRWIGAVLITFGLVVLIESFARFATRGSGTPAPVAPPKHLVVSGLYRHTRNPMYVGVISVVAGQALLMGDVGLIWYAAVVWLGFHLFVLLHEEPTLRVTFGEEYGRFCANVPRWLPRLRPWRADPMA